MLLADESEPKPLAIHVHSPPPSYSSKENVGPPIPPPPPPTAVLQQPGQSDDNRTSPPRDLNTGTAADHLESGCHPCWGGGRVQVERCAYKIFHYGLFTSLMNLFYHGVYSRQPTSILWYLHSLALYTCILVALRYRKPGWYLPFLVGNAICLFILIPGTIIAALVLNYLHSDECTGPYSFLKEEYKDWTPQKRTFVANSATAFVIIALAFYGWLFTLFHRVVWRAYKHMKECNRGDAASSTPLVAQQQNVV